MLSFFLSWMFFICFFGCFVFVWVGLLLFGFSEGFLVGFVLDMLSRVKMCLWLGVWSVAYLWCIHVHVSKCYKVGACMRI